VWFDKDTAEERYPALLKLIAKKGADIIFLQEVTPSFIRHQRSSEAVEQYSFYTTSNAQRSYGLAYLAKIPLDNLRTVSLPSQYGRTVFFATYEVAPNEWLVLANVHLESGQGEQAARSVQIEVINTKILPAYIDELRDIQPKIKVLGMLWGGDFNIDGDESHSLLDTHWLDVASKQSDLYKMTYDVKANPLANKTSGWFESSSRLDRFYFQSMNRNSKVNSYRVIDTVNGIKNILSDHYPVYTELVFE